MVKKKPRKPDIFTATSNTEVKNGVRTSKCKPLGRISSWIKYYKVNVSQSFEECAIVDCSKTYLVGGHMILKEKGIQFWILPICHKHNYRKNDQWMRVKEGRKLVEVTEDVSHDKCQKQQ